MNGTVSKLEITDCLFSSNEASINGGGIYFDDQSNYFNAEQCFN